MGNKKIHPFTLKFHKHILNFLRSQKIILKGKKVYLGLSGGLDSVSLFYVLIGLMSEEGFKFEAIHIHHGQRESSHDDLEFVESLCRNFSIRLHKFRYELKLETNIESTLREFRYKCFNSVAREDDLVLLGHHLDDAFEWSLLSRLKFGRLNLGIPFKNKNIIRPFLCVSRKQIESYQKVEKFWYRIDESNEDHRFERNFLRSQVKAYKDKFPKYLKHYVSQQKQLRDLIGRRVKKEIIKDRLGGVRVSINDDLEALKESIEDGVKLVSTVKRGKISAEVGKYIKARRNGKKGPHNFSGGVLGFYDGESYYLIHKDSYSKITKASQIPARSYLNSFELFVARSSKRLVNTSTENPLYAKISKDLNKDEYLISKDQYNKFTSCNKPKDYDVIYIIEISLKF